MGLHRHASNLLRFQYISVSRTDPGNPVAKEPPVKIGNAQRQARVRPDPVRMRLPFRLAS